MSKIEDEEIWVPVPSKPGIKVSSWGRYVLPPSTAKMPHGGERTYSPGPRKGVVTKASKTARHEYYGFFNKKYGNVKVHRIVCEGFHGPAPFPKAVVIHLDENALNNRPENLKWGTQKENLNMPGFVTYCKSRVGEGSPLAKWREAQRKKLNGQQAREGTTPGGHPNP